MNQENDQGVSTRREEMEMLRVYWAAERTLLAWIRTGVAMMGFGFIVARFGLFLREMALLQRVTPGDYPVLSLWIGTALIGLGVLIHAVSAAQHYRFLRHFAGTLSHRSGWPFLGIIISLMLVALGLVMAAYLFILPQ